MYQPTEDSQVTNLHLTTQWFDNDCGLRCALLHDLFTFSGVTTQPTMQIHSFKTTHQQNLWICQYKIPLLGLGAKLISESKMWPGLHAARDHSAGPSARCTVNKVVASAKFDSKNYCKLLRTSFFMDLNERFKRLLCAGQSVLRRLQNISQAMLN